jgi:uncharacterized membrane protein
MTLGQGVIAYACAAVVMLPLDLAWLGTVGRSFYRSRLGPLLLERPAWGPALAFYLLYVVGVVIFAIAPAVRDGAWTTALLFGAMFGFFAYATYDLSNLATLKGFSPEVAMLDIAWGTVLTALTAAGGYGLARFFNAV